MGKKSLLSSILSGALFAVSFVLTKGLMQKALLRDTQTPDASQHPKCLGSFLGSSLKPGFIHRKVASTKDEIPDQTRNGEQEVPFQIEEPARAGEKPLIQKSNLQNLTEHSFCMDYPKCSVADSTSIIHNNTIMVDAVSFTTAYGIDLLYSRDKGTLTLIFNDDTLIFNLRTREAKLNNSKIETNQSAILRDDTLFIPLPLTAEVFGIKVKNNDLDRILTIGG